MPHNPQTTDKPLFIPLMGIYFDAFKDGRKMYEYRPLGKRWNERTCFVGRRAVLSRGYGKQHRLERTVLGLSIIVKHKPNDFVKIYGDEVPCLAIKLA